MEGSNFNIRSKINKAKATTQTAMRTYIFASEDANFSIQVTTNESLISALKTAEEVTLNQCILMAEVKATAFDEGMAEIIGGLFVSEKRYTPRFSKS